MSVALMNYPKEEYLNKYKKTMKLTDEVGMAGPKSTQTRFVGIITSTIHPYACFLSRCRNKLGSNATIKADYLPHHPLQAIICDRI